MVALLAVFMGAYLERWKFEESRKRSNMATCGNLQLLVTSLKGRDRCLSILLK